MRDSTGQDRTGQDRTGQDRTGQDRTGQDRTGEALVKIKLYEVIHPIINIVVNKKAYSETMAMKERVPFLFP